MASYDQNGRNRRDQALYDRIHHFYLRKLITINIRKVYEECTGSVPGVY